MRAHNFPIRGGVAITRAIDRFVTRDVDLAGHETTVIHHIVFEGDIYHLVIWRPKRRLVYPDFAEHRRSLINYCDDLPGGGNISSAIGSPVGDCRVADREEIIRWHADSSNGDAQAIAAGPRRAQSCVTDKRTAG